MKELLDKLYLCNLKNKGIYNCKLFTTYEQLIKYHKNNKLDDNYYIISVEDDYKNIDDYIIKSKLQNELVKQINITK